MKNTKFGTKEIVETIKEYLENVDVEDLGEGSEFALSVATDEYKFSDEDEGEKALIDYGVFKAIREVRDEELEASGELDTDLSNPVEVANALWVLKVEQFINENLENIVDKVWDTDITVEVRNQLLETIKSLEN